MLSLVAGRNSFATQVMNPPTAEVLMFEVGLEGLDVNGRK